jgi:alcohol dehydrogenase class IV
LPYGIEINLRALRARAPQSDALRRYQEVAHMLTGRADAVADEAVAWTREICRELAIPPLSSYGMGEPDVPALIGAAAKASSMKGNPLALTPEELGEVLSMALVGDR